MRYNTTITFDNVFLLDSFTICSNLEKKGRIGKYINKNSEDNYYNSKSFEKAEIKFLKQSIEYLSSKYDVDLIICGDLNESNMASNYANKNNDIPFLGIYGACSNIIQSIIIASNFIQSKNYYNIICATSSHNSNAEKLFRYPIEYGYPKWTTQTYTATGAVSVLVSSKPSSVKIINGTVGKIIDVDFKDANDFGRVMAPSAIDTYINHMKDLNLKDDYYDLVVTGDLSSIGSNIFLKGVNTFGYTIKEYNDCGLILFDVDKQKVNMGGSGCATVGLVFLSYIKELMLKGKYKRVLVIGTGALINKSMTLQNESIPAISYAIGVEKV